MSKMSEIAMLLDDQAVELGFESYEEAIAKGYDVCYGEKGAYLYKPQPEDEQLKAHKAWLKEKEEQLDRLDGVIDYLKHEEENYLTKFLIHELKEVERYIKERA